ncbi:MAG: hypothetical protein QE271_11740 [Bacteriovoracaceae bacterium]|nr:hypothetical protein [Bacteriovoracaceae bacterium]
MNFSLSGILASLIFSTLGIYFFKRGRKDLNNGLVVIGILLFGYSYFIESDFWMWTTGALLTGLGFFLKERNS